MNVKNLKKLATDVRKSTLSTIYQAGSGHPLGSLSSVEIFVSLYFEVARNDPKNPNWDKRDRIFVSHGHTAPALYSVMAKRGYFAESKLSTYCKLGSGLQGHPERNKLPGIEITSGSLGMGSGQAVGYLLASKLDKKDFKVFVVTSDGEHDEGSHWESVALASKYKLSNLIQIIDRNGIQINGPTEKVLPLSPLKKKYESFGWKVFETDGNNFKKLIPILKKAKREKTKPSVVIAKTIAGKGVSFMEREAGWHAKAPNEKEYEKAVRELGNRD